MEPRQPTSTCHDCGNPVGEPDSLCQRCHAIFTRRAMREAAPPAPRLPRTHRRSWQRAATHEPDAPDPAPGPSVLEPPGAIRPAGDETA